MASQPQEHNLGRESGHLLSAQVVLFPPFPRMTHNMTLPFCAEVCLIAEGELYGASHVWAAGEMCTRLR